MAITAEEVAQVLTQMGVTPQSFAQLMQRNGLVMQLRQLDAAIELKQAERDAALQQFEGELQTLQQQRAALKAQVDGALSG
jgi:ABC-type hemin transport system substrate-binding protein